MKSTERTLTIAVGSVAALFVAYIVLDKVLFSPAAELNAAARKGREQIRKLKTYNAREAAYHDRLKELSDSSFGTDLVQAGELVRDRLMTILAASGLASEDHALHPTGKTAGRKPYREIGRSISARGALKHVVNFLYLVSADKYIHRLENLTMKPELQKGEVSLQVRYTTLALDKAKSLMPATTPTEAPVATLDTEQRQAYTVITERDLFRPYIKRRAEPPGPKPPRPTSKTARPKPRPADSFSIVGLPRWPDGEEVYVRNNRSGKTRVYHLGDALAGGKIVMIDYRLLPKPDKPKLLSSSRVIVKIGEDYWAVDLGQTLKKKRRLEGEVLPPRLWDKKNE